MLILAISQSSSSLPSFLLTLCCHIHHPHPSRPAPRRPPPTTPNLAPPPAAAHYAPQSPQTPSILATVVLVAIPPLPRSVLPLPSAFQSSNCTARRLFEYSVHIIGHSCALAWRRTRLTKRGWGSGSSPAASRWPLPSRSRSHDHCSRINVGGCPHAGEHARLPTATQSDGGLLVEGRNQPSRTVALPGGGLRFSQCIPRPAGAFVLHSQLSPLQCAAKRTFAHIGR